MSRAKPAAGKGAVDAQAAKEKEKKTVPKLEDFLQARDYTGAVTLLEVITNFRICHTFNGFHVHCYGI